MADLAEKQWELGGVVFGLDCRVQSDPDIQLPATSGRENDTANPVGDDLFMGRDRRTAGSWAFKLFVDEQEEAAALDALDELATVWDAEDVRTNPGVVMPLRYRLADRVRRVYGRPRRWTAPLSNGLLNGYIAITADFQLTVPLYFDDAEDSVEIGSRPAVSSDGFDVPLDGFEAPIDFDGEAAPTYEVLVVRGRKATPATVTFHGPSLNPKLDVGDWAIQLNTSIPENEEYTVDTRPWSMGLTSKDGTPLPGNIISRSTRLREMTLRCNPDGSPREYSAVHTASDTLGQSKVTVRWRNAHVSP